MRKVAYSIATIADYGSLVAFCIENDISVRQTLWNEFKKDNRCFCIDWDERFCYYASRLYFETEGYEIKTPLFYVNKYGKIGILGVKK